MASNSCKSRIPRSNSAASCARSAAPERSATARRSKLRVIVGAHHRWSHGQNRLCMRRRLTRKACLIPDNDPSPAPFGALAPNAAQAVVISLARRTRLKRGAFRPMLSRLLNLLRAGPVDAEYQGASFRFHHQASATERGALFNPDYNLEELQLLRKHTPTGGVFVDI